jgi:hypothetical protein
MSCWICFSTTSQMLQVYLTFQAYSREFKPPLLAIWGKNDAFFNTAGAHAYRRDNPNATVELLDTGILPSRPTSAR